MMIDYQFGIDSTHVIVLILLSVRQRVSSVPVPLGTA